MAMGKKFDANRRNFLKSSAAGAAGVLVTGSRVREAQAQASVWPATGYIQINPAIDNCRVVYVKDAAMVKRANYANFGDANKNAIDHARVKANVERMACALARQTTPAAAWPVIFRKPPTKNWPDVKVAIKVNACGNVSPCIGIITKISEALFGLGVQYSNITVYDWGAATGAGAYNKYNPFLTDPNVKLPPINVLNRVNADDGKIAITVGTWQTVCIQLVQDADILLSIAVDKGHDRMDQFSGVTMSLKNHVGTINFGHPGDNPGVYRLCEYHKHPIILGTPSATVPAKQQLCIVDGLWAGKPGDWTGGIDDPNGVLGTLSMGTLAGPLDYYTAKVLRAPKYANTTANNVNVTRINEFITGFGYSAAEQAALDTMNPATDPQGRGFVDALTCECGGVALDAGTYPPADSGAGGSSGAGGATGKGGAAGTGGTGGASAGAGGTSVGAGGAPVGAGGASVGAGGAPGFGGAAGGGVSQGGSAGAFGLGGAAGASGVMSAGGAAGAALGAGGAAVGAGGASVGAGGVAGALAGAAGAALQAAADAGGCACGVAVGSVASGVLPMAAAIGGVVLGVGRRAAKVEKERAQAKADQNTPPKCPGAPPCPGASKQPKK
jgi:hypothetical protein